MTIIRDIETECSVCGETTEQPVLMSTNSWGYPDLDLRPPEMQRATMHVWIQECPHCGYVAGDLSDELEISKDYLKCEEYKTCEGNDFKSDLAGRFYKRHMIARILYKIFIAFSSYTILLHTTTLKYFMDNHVCFNI